ncbi:hypothetical protein [Lysinibacillus sp. FSL K6-0102]|uniref:hypothetical protein n=1 Tax=Lysinibacillus sp. FSL K6-0102 TaxID=2975290 RepID=UPI0030F824FA
MEKGYEVIMADGVINLVFANGYEFIDGDYYFFNRGIYGSKLIVTSYQKDEVSEINEKIDMKKYMDTIYKGHNIV